jgi:hypothetical protein
MADTPGGETAAGHRSSRVFNASSDTVTLLRDALDAAGFRTVRVPHPGHQAGRVDLIEFVERHAPSAFVYDISPAL